MHPLVSGNRHSIQEEGIAGSKENSVSMGLLHNDVPVWIVQ